MYRGFIAALSRESEHRPGAPHQPPPRLVASEQLGGRFATRLILEIWRVAPSVRPMISSRALKNAKYERYCRLRASALPRIQVYREVGWRSREDDVACINACRLERRSEIRDRIAYLSQQEEALVAEKRGRIEEQLWEIHEADFGDCFETYEAAKVGKDGKLEIDGDGKMLNRAQAAAETSIRSAAGPSQSNRACTARRSGQRCAAALFQAA
jgi:hypothetical protein